MKFFFMVALVLGVGFFCMTKCKSGFTNPASWKKERVEASSPAPGQVLPPLQDKPFVPSIPPTMQNPVVSAVYVFKRRTVPPPEQFNPLLSAGRTSLETTAIVVDRAANAVLVRGNTEAVASLLGAVELLDVESAEAFCDAYMLFVRGDKVRDFEASISFSEGLSINGSASISSDGFGVVMPAGNLSARINWLASNGIVEVVDRPQLRLSSGHESVVATGDDVPFPQTTFRDGIATTAIQFKRVGLSFAVMPLFLTSSRVRLDVVAENGLLGPVQKIADVEVPSITTQVVKSAATLGFDDSIMIGGLESIRREKRFGLFGQSEKTTAGRLYVAVMLRSGIPKAVPVISASSDLGIAVPGVLGTPGAFDDSLLPPKGWKLSDLFPDGKSTSTADPLPPLRLGRPGTK